MPKRVSPYRRLAYGLLASTALTGALVVPGPARAQTVSAGTSLAAGVVDGDETFAIGAGPEHRSGEHPVPGQKAAADPSNHETTPAGGARALPAGASGSSLDTAAGAVPVRSLIDALSQSISTLIGGGPEEAVMVSGSLEASENSAPPAPALTRATPPAGPSGRGNSGAGQMTGRMRVPLRAAASVEAPGSPVVGVPIAIEGAPFVAPGKGATPYGVIQVLPRVADVPIDLHGMDGAGGCVDARRPERYAEGDDEVIGLGDVLKGAVRSVGGEASASPAGNILWIAGDAQGPGIPPPAAAATDAMVTSAAWSGGRPETSGRALPGALAEAPPALGRPPAAVAITVGTPSLGSPKAATGVVASGDRPTGGSGDLMVVAPVAASSSDAVPPRQPADAPLLAGSSAATSGALGAGRLSATLPGGYGVAFIGPSSLTAPRAPIALSGPARAGSIAVTTAVTGPTILIAANSYAGTSPVWTVAALPTDGSDMAGGSADQVSSHVICGGGTLVTTVSGVAPLPPAAAKPDSGPTSPILVRMLAMTPPGGLGGGRESGPPDDGARRYSSSADETPSGVISDGGTVVAEPGADATLPPTDADRGAGPILARMLAGMGSGALGAGAPGFDEAPISIAWTSLPDGDGFDAPTRIDAVAANDR